MIVPGTVSPRGLTSQTVRVREAKKWARTIDRSEPCATEEMGLSTLEAQAKKVGSDNRRIGVRPGKAVWTASPELSLCTTPTTSLAKEPSLPTRSTSSRNGPTVFGQGDISTESETTP